MAAPLTPSHLEKCVEVRVDVGDRPEIERISKRNKKIGQKCSKIIWEVQVRFRFAKTSKIVVVVPVRSYLNFDGCAALHNFF